MMRLFLRCRGARRAGALETDSAMRPMGRSLLRVSLVLNAFLLFSYGIWYLQKPTVSLTTELSSERGLLAATAASERPTLAAERPAMEAERLVATVVGRPTEAAAAVAVETLAPEIVEPPGPQCALSQLQRCQNVVPRARSTMRGTRYWAVHNFLMGERRFACDETVTYTTHGDFTFLDNVAPLVRRWRAPVSFGLYAPAEDFVPSMEALAYLRHCDEPLIRALVTFHVIFDVDKVPKNVTDGQRLLAKQPDCSKPPPWVGKASYRKAKKLTYPVNVMRNVARETVMTHFVFPSDVELYPSEGLAEQFLDMVRRNTADLCRPSPRVFVLSIFEVAANHSVPLRKDILTGMLKNGTAIPFHKFVCPQCHQIPKAKEWTFSNETQQLDVFHVAKRHPPFGSWEPIYIWTNDEPLYDERLTWEGKMDKMGQVRTGA